LKKKERETMIKDKFALGSNDSNVVSTWKSPLPLLLPRQAGWRLCELTETASRKEARQARFLPDFSMRIELI
jgi:hypothetical protein